MEPEGRREDEEHTMYKTTSERCVAARFLFYFCLFACYKLVCLRAVDANSQ